MMGKKGKSTGTQCELGRVVVDLGESNVDSLQLLLIHKTSEAEGRREGITYTSNI